MHPPPGLLGCELDGGGLDGSVGVPSFNALSTELYADFLLPLPL